MPQATQFKFNFKSRAIKDEAGNTIGRTKKQDSLEVSLPTLDAEELAVLLMTPDSAVAKLIVEAATRLVIDAARDQFDEAIEGFGDDNSKVITVDVLDFDKLTLDYIASIPPTQRASSAIPDEDWAAFYADYLTAMMAATGKEATRINNHINFFKKPTKAKTNKDVLAVLVDQLDIYMAATANLEEHAACADRVASKFKAWLDAPEAAPSVDLL